MSRAIYVSGPMRGYEEFNYPAFNEAADALRLEGWEVFNPAEMSGGVPPAPEDMTREKWQNYMRGDVAAIAQCDAIAVLPGWEYSEGARIEVDLGRRLGLDMYRYDELAIGRLQPLGRVGYLEARDTVEEGLNLVYGARGKKYGHPFDNFTSIGRGWGAILGIEDIDPETVAIMLRWLKISRHTYVRQADNIVDEVGYAVTEMRVDYRRDGIE